MSKQNDPTKNEQLEKIQTKIVPNTDSPEHKDAEFDPIAYIDERLMEPALKAKVASTAVWTFDQRLLDTGIGLYFDIRKENPDAKDIGALIDAFNATYSYEGFWGEGRAKQLVRMLVLQPQWHGTAVRLNYANGFLTYAPRSIDELVLTAKPRGVSPKMRTNLEANAEFVAEDGNMTKEEALADLLAAEKYRAETNVEFRKEILPAINTFIMSAQKRIALESPQPEGIPAIDTIPDDRHQFWMLDTATKLMIVRGCLGGVNRSLTDLARVLDPTAYMMCLREAAAAKKVFTRVVDKLARELERERAEV